MNLFSRESGACNDEGEQIFNIAYDFKEIFPSSFSYNEMVNFIAFSLILWELIFKKLKLKSKKK